MQNNIDIGYYCVAVNVLIGFVGKFLEFIFAD